MDEKRYFQRVPFDSATFVIFHEQKVSAKLIDISLKGALVTLDYALPMQKNDLLLLKLCLSGSTVEIDMVLTAVHLEGLHVGGKLHSIDAESLTHLRRLLEMNLGSSEEVERELNFFPEHHG